MSPEIMEAAQRWREAARTERAIQTEVWECHRATTAAKEAFLELIASEVGLSVASDGVMGNLGLVVPSK